MAIAFDATASDGVNSTDTVSFSHTTASGSDRIMLVAVCNSGASTDTSTVTYNSVSLTRIDNSTFNNTSLWLLENPDTGANTVEVTLDASADRLAARSYTFTGVKKHGQLLTDTDTLTGIANTVGKGPTVSGNMILGVMGADFTTAGSWLYTGSGTHAFEVDPGANLRLGTTYYTSGSGMSYQVSVSTSAEYIFYELSEGLRINTTLSG